MWTCPKCESKVDPSFEVCWNCGTSRDGVEDPSFVHADEAPPIPNSPDFIGVEPADVVAGTAPPPFPGAEGAEVVECYQAFSLMEAKFLADQLNAQGIPAVSDTQDLQDGLGPMDGNPRVYCRAEDFERARAWLLDYEEKRRADPNRLLEP